MNWTNDDIQMLTSNGIDFGQTQRPARRSTWAPERTLQAAADGTLLAANPETCQLEELPISLDGAPATESEARAAIDLLTEGLLDWHDIDLVPSPRGKRVLNRWARYMPLQ